MESKLALQAQKGDQQAFAELVDRYKNKIYYLAYRMLGDTGEAEDLVQDTFLRVYQNLHRYNTDLKFSTWIYRVATNLCIDRLRKRKQYISYSLDSQIEDENINGYVFTASDTLTPEEQIVMSETQLAIMKAIEKLPIKYKTIFILRYLHDMSLQEITEIVNLPMSTVKTRVHRAREFMRKRLEKKM